MSLSDGSPVARGSRDESGRAVLTRSGRRSTVKVSQLRGQTYRKYSPLPIKHLLRLLHTRPYQQGMKSHPFYARGVESKSGKILSGEINIF